jgi:hypothetical protein
VRGFGKREFLQGGGGACAARRPLSSVSNRLSQSEGEVKGACGPCLTMRGFSIINKVLETDINMENDIITQTAEEYITSKNE